MKKCKNMQKHDEKRKKNAKTWWTMQKDEKMIKNEIFCDLDLI